MPKTLNDKTPDSLYCMLKGEPGTRKSTQALSFPKPQYWFSIDKKMRALKLPMKIWNIDPTQITYDDYSAWLGANSIYPMLEQFSLKCPYKTIVIDSITSMGDTVNLQTMRDKTKDGNDYRIGGIRVNTLEDYKAEASAFTHLIDITKQIQSIHNVNIVLVAHIVGERAAKEVNTTSHARIIVTGGKTISGKIPAYCDEIYHFDMEASPIMGRPGNLAVYTQYTGDDYARTSLNLPHKIELGDKQLYDGFIAPALVELNK